MGIYSAEEHHIIFFKGEEILISFKHNAIVYYTLKLQIEILNQKETVIIHLFL